MNLQECKCWCHNKPYDTLQINGPGYHTQPCCHYCPYCDNLIKASIYNEHVVSCKQLEYWIRSASTKGIKQFNDKQWKEWEARQFYQDTYNEDYDETLEPLNI